MDVEEAFSVAGSFGRFQIVASLINFSSNIAFGSQMVFLVIAGATPNKGIPSEANLSTIVTEWDLYHEAWVINLIESLFMVGYIVGCLAFGQLPDLYGRKPVMLINFFLAMLCCFLSAFCNSWQTFAVTRFLAGLFGGGCVPPAFVLLCELMGKDSWGVIGMIFSIFFSFGVMLLSLLGYLLQDWRKIIWVSSGLCALILPAFYFLVPESPRWLYSVGKTEKAEKIMKLIARRNGRDPSRIVLKERSDNVDNPISPRKYTIVDLVKNRTLSIRLLICCYLWFASSLSYYGQTLDAGDLTPNLFLAVVLSGAVEIPATIIALILMDRKWAGRKGTTIWLLLLSSITSIGIIFITDTISVAKTVLGLISKLSISGGFSLLFIYVSELYPAQLRVLAMGVTNLFARVGGIISPFVPMLASTAIFMPYAVFGIVTLIAAALCILLPETVGQRLADMSDFEKSEVIESIENTNQNINEPEGDIVVNDKVALIT